MNLEYELSRTSPVRTLIVDDAPLMRKIIREILGKNGDIEVVGTAVHGLDCLEKIPQLRPEVVTLDIDMPVMNGITAIKNIMVRYQIPIVIISSLVQDGYFAFEALRLGVMDFLPKPSKVASNDWAAEEDLVRMRVQAASGMQVHRMRRVRRHKRASDPHDASSAPPSAVVVMGTTLAGPNTIMHIVTQLKPEFSGAIIALQEIHPRILVPFCAYFNEISPLEVVPVTDSNRLCAGKVYIGSTFKGLRVGSSLENPDELMVYVPETGDSPIDQLFDSAAARFKQNTCGVLLTGVGVDGAEGMRAIKAGGGITIGQDQECCVYPNLVENAVQQKVVDLLMTNQGHSRSHGSVDGGQAVISACRNGRPCRSGDRE